MVKMIKFPSLMEYFNMPNDERAYWDSLKPYLGYVNPHSKSDLVPLIIPDNPAMEAEILKNPAYKLDMI